MTSPFRAGLAAATTALLLSFAAQADIVLSNFDNFSLQYFAPMGTSWNGGSPSIDQYVQNTGYISITPVNGGDPKGDGYFFAGLPGSATLNFTGLTFLSINARVDAGNASSIFHIQLFDDVNPNPVATTTFTASSFTSSFSTQSAAIVLSGIGDITHITYWRMDGDNINSNSFRYSFENLSAITAVPEPSTYALGAVSLLALCIARRGLCKRRAA